MGTEHDRLWTVVKQLPGDYEPWGSVKRWEDPVESYPDCSMGCAFFKPMKGYLQYDWGVCTNPASHRVGLLTFEHQGCQQFRLDRK